MSLKTKITKWLGELLAEPLERLARWIDEQNKIADEARKAEEPETDGEKNEPISVPTEPKEQETSKDEQKNCLSAYPLGLASCWGGSNASKRMMNCLAPKMADSTFKDRLKFMLDRGCTVAHVILANGGDGESAGYAAWRDADKAKMLERLHAIEAAGLVPVPWLITDDSASMRKELFANADKLVKRMADFILGSPYCVLGLEMDEEKATLSEWRKVRDALRKIYAGPIGVHHTSGNNFAFASLGDIILGQLYPGCTESQVASQIHYIRQNLGKRAVGFEYDRGPNRKLAVAALKAGAEGCGNWDGGDVPGTSQREASSSAAESVAEDAVDFALLAWDYGGFRGSSAKIDANARIYNLQINASSMAYRWMSGGCENLGASNREDASCLACLFCLIDGKWVGGKFDWISTSRTTRDFKNINDGYNGWRRDAIGKASRYAFVIVSKDGKRRTNVIACGK